MNTIEQLLSSPLPTIHDKGFSQALIEKLERIQQRRQKILLLAYVAMGIFAWLLIPLKSIFARFIDIFSNSVTFIFSLLPYKAASLEGLVFTLNSNVIFLCVCVTAVLFVFYDTQNS